VYQPEATIDQPFLSLPSKTAKTIGRGAKGGFRRETARDT